MALPGISRFSGRVALVTGASAGIGAAIADSLVKNGLIVVGCARNPDSINEHAKQLASKGYADKLLAYKCDVGKEDEVEKMFQWIEEKHGGVDVCINNAGFAVVEPLLESNAANMRAMLDVNFIGLVMCTKLTIKSMRSRGIDDGHIINISSVVGFQTRVIRFCYAATKYALRALTEGFRKELHDAGLNIRISVISPGLTETRFHYDHYGEEKAKEMYATAPCIQPVDVANAVIHALSQPANVQVHDIILEATRVKPT
jgi:NADP-dependent 3-hydroxy acid dehydrogenase YdfG